MENGISKFMHKLGKGYAQYFNKRNSRSGSLFQGPFQAVPVITDEQLLYLSAYVNGNPEIHKIAKAENWQWSSYRDYLGKRKGTLARKEVILKEFNSVREYQRYVDRVIKNSAKIKEEIKKCLIDL